MAKLITAFFFEPDLLPLIPRTYMIETESHSFDLSSGLHMHTAGICTHRPMQNEKIFNLTKVKIY